LGSLAAVVSKGNGGYYSIPLELAFGVQP